MIRFISIVLFLGGYFIISIPMWLIVLIIGIFNRHARDILALRLVQFAFRVIRLISGTKTTIIGLENIPKDEAVLFVGNHRSFYDIIIPYSIMPNVTGFVAKKQMRKVPFINVWMKFLYCQFLDRENIKEGHKVIINCVDLVKNNDVSIAIFPEGTRNHGDEMLPFKEGSMKIAEKSGCKIIPMVQNNTASIWENQAPRVKKAHTVLEFAKPIDVNSLSKEERKFLGAYVRDRIQEIYEKNQKLV